MESLRIYKHGAETYTEVTSATDGGFSSLSFDRVRNDAGGLTFDLKAITIAQLHEWIDEASRVEYWFGEDLIDVYLVDSYSTKWGSLTATVNCVGQFASGKDTPFSGSFTDPAAALEAMVEAGGWGWSALKVDIPEVAVDLEYSDANLCDAMQELAETIGVTFRIDPTGDFACNPNYTDEDVSEELTLGKEAVEFDTTYSSADIVNRLVLVADNGTWTYDDATSQSAYGIRQQKVSASGLGGYSTGLAWATEVFRVWAKPQLQITLTAAHSDERLPGEMIEVLGLDDGRTYIEPIAQISWETGSLYDTLKLGVKAPSIKAPTLREDTSTSKVSTSLSLEADEEDPYTLIATLTTDADTPFVGTPKIKIIVAPQAEAEELDTETASMTVATPAVGAEVAYRAVFAGDSLHDGSESSDVTVTNEKGALTETDKDTTTVSIEAGDDYQLIATLQATAVDFSVEPNVSWEKVADPVDEVEEAITRVFTKTVPAPDSGKTATWRAKFTGDGSHEGSYGDITIDENGEDADGGSDSGGSSGSVSGTLIGTVSAVNGDGTIDIDTEDGTIEGVSPLASYSPTVGDDVAFGPVES